MKGKLTKLMMVAMMLVTLLGLSATAVTVSPTAVSAAVNEWSRMDLPTTQNYQMLPASDIWDLTSAADGTLFALVEDTTTNGSLSHRDVADGGAMLWDGLRWAVHPSYSDIAVFKSTDGGYNWQLTWHIPATETGAPIAVVPQPGYSDTDSAKDTVFVAMGSRYVIQRNTSCSVALVAGGLGTGNIYRSLNGGADFTRITPRCPGVTTTSGGGTITSLAVAECAVCATGCQNPGMAIVGISSLGTGGNPDPTVSKGEGVYTWNENNVPVWQDKEISDAIQFISGATPPAPGTMPAGNGLDVLAVLASPNYTTDGQIVAVVNDIRDSSFPTINMDSAGMPKGVYTCFWSTETGSWGGDVNNPTNAITMTGVIPPAPTAPWAGGYALGAAIAVGSDYSASSAWVFVALYGTGTGAFTTIPTVTAPFAFDGVYRVRGLSTVTGPSRVANLGLGAFWIDDLAIPGAADTAIYAGCEFPLGQAQVFKCQNATLWGAWTPSFKPPSGASPVFVTGNLFAAGGSDRGTEDASTGLIDVRTTTTSGVSKMVDTATRGPVYNGVGLLDDIAVSQDIPGYESIQDPAPATWCLAEAVSEEVSPTYSSDGLIYVGVMSDWAVSEDGDSATYISEHGKPLYTGLSMWRLTSNKWERIMYEGITRPYSYGNASSGTACDIYQGYEVFAGMSMKTNSNVWRFVDDWTWVPKVVPQFSTDGSMFILGGVNDRNNSTSITPTKTQAYQEMVWYSPDKGDSWSRISQMPIGAIPISAVGLSESGWCVQDSNTLFLGDVAGWIYRTTNRGAAWTDGALTGEGLEIDAIVTSPIFSMAGTSGTDECLAIGTYEKSTGYDEVWLSRDGGIKDLNNIGDEIYTNPSWTRSKSGSCALTLKHTWNPTDDDQGGVVVAFDKNWATNNLVYAAGRGYLDEWQLTGPGATDVTRIDKTDASIVRTTVDLADPSASTWDTLYSANDWNSLAPTPQPYPAMSFCDRIYRIVAPTAIQIGTDGTIYVTYSIWDESYNPNGDSPTPNYGFGRYTYAGILRCLDGSVDVSTEWNTMRNGLGPWDGLYLNRIVPGSNDAISLTFDWKEWRFKLAFWEDTLSGAGPTVVSPVANAQGVGALLADTSVSVPLSWQAKAAATQYEWQVSEDNAFTAANTKSGTTSDLTVTVPGLKPSTTYYWRSRALLPMLGRWNTAQQFTTVIGGESGAPKLVTPEVGATITDKTPLFTWGAVASASNYEIQVATSPTFGSADIVIDKTLGNVQAYEADKDLVNGTYYWQVKGTNATTKTETPWSALGSFTLNTAAGGQGTPVWVWVLIVLGCLLGVVVLVLILRTRRPV